MKGPYINEEGDLWIERGSAPWPRVRAEAASYAWEISDSGKVKYLGIEKDVRVSDNNEAQGIHYDDEDCEIIDGKPCCRTVEAYHFQAVEM